MPAASSSLIPAGLAQLAGCDPAGAGELPDLLDRLRHLPDSRRLRGRRHRLSYVLALAACSVLAGAKSLTAIAEWAADASDQLLLHCGATLRDPDPALPGAQRGDRAPGPAAYRRRRARCGDRRLAHRSCGRLSGGAERDEHPPPRPVRVAVAVDGKSLRGATRSDGRCVHLLSVLRGDGIVLAQREGRRRKATRSWCSGSTAGPADPNPNLRW